MKIMFLPTQKKHNFSGYKTIKQVILGNSTFYLNVWFNTMLLARNSLLDISTIDINIINCNAFTL